jgi:ribosomal-protein-alanine N-acetyltransferase
VRVRPAVPADVERLAALERAGFDTPWTAGQIAEEIGFPEALVLVADPGPDADAASAPQTGAGAAGYAAFRRFDDEAELLRIAVAPDHRRSGVGRALIADGLTRLAGLGVTVCHLEVEAGNRPATGLYEATGFHKIGRRRGYYGSGRDALLYACAVRPGAA